MSSGLQKIADALSQLQNEGFTTDQIYLLGFSQGACLSLEYAARHPQRFGGVIGLSGGMIGMGPSLPIEEYEGDLAKTPIFLGCSDRDPHIAKERVQETAEIMTRLNGSVDMRLYPNMGHTVNRDELDAVRSLMGLEAD
jgi:phospholipase/carboxylesterase